MEIKVLNDQFRNTISLLEESSDHFFITGKAGTGKSTLLSLFRQQTSKKVAVLAPTGVAALNVSGQTLHSFFRFPPKILHPEEITKIWCHKLYKALDAIIIDEISMVRADFLDQIDIFLRINVGKDVPFGGKQMIFFGDLFQLPPVISSPTERNYLRMNYDSPYFFSALVFNQIEFETIELFQVFRQRDRNFINLLDAIRMGMLDYDIYEEINLRSKVEIPDDNIISLCSRRNTAERINKKQLEALDGRSHTYNATVTGNFNTNHSPTQVSLSLKAGSQVMCLKNDSDKRYVNGSIAKVIRLKPDLVTIRLVETDDEVDIKAESWDNIKYVWDEKEGLRSKIEGSFKQIPLLPAWAITIHKSQGKTFEKVIIDLGSGAFEFGQVYVALSRCKSLEGVFLNKAIRPHDIKVDPVISEFYTNRR